MFYCEACRERNKWPDSFSMSIGPCEMCGKRAACYDRSSSSLPTALPTDPSGKNMEEVAIDVE